jgi:hypothetical protein
MYCYCELLIAPVKKEFVDVKKDQKLKAAVTRNIEVR